MPEEFDLERYTACDCAQHANQTCDKCALRGYIESLRASLTRVEEERDARPTIEEWSNEIDRVRDHWKGKLTAQAQDVLSVINPILQGPAGVELSSAQCEQLVLLEDRLSRDTRAEGK